MMKKVAPEHWQGVLDFNGLADFNTLWELKTDWFEPPNERRGGWSGVCRHILSLPGGGQIGIFVKRQENHVTKTWLHPFRGIATSRREYHNMLKMQRWGIPVPELVYYAYRREGNRIQAILITRELSGFKSLNNFFSPRQNGVHIRRRVTRAVARTVRGIHSHHFHHASLYPKHIMLRLDPDDGQHIQVVIIDWEKARRRVTPLKPVLYDLDTLCRHCSTASRSDKMFFWKHYCSAGRPVSPVIINWLTQALMRRTRRKQTKKETRAHRHAVRNPGIKDQVK